jgi:hypothetical protein
MVIHKDDRFSNGTRVVELARLKGKGEFFDSEIYLSWRSFFRQKLFFDVFLEGTYGTHSLIDVSHVSKEYTFIFRNVDLYYDDQYATFSFGALKEINENSRIIAGYKMNFHSEDYSNLYLRTNSFFIQYEYDFMIAE